MLDNNEADVLLWISTYSPEHVPPKTKARVILIGHPKMKVPGHVDVYIPVGIPGIDHTGLACRTDPLENFATLIYLPQVMSLNKLQSLSSHGD